MTPRTSNQLTEPQVKGGQATLAKLGVEHYRRMGRLSAATRKQNREFLAARQVAVDAIIDQFGVPETRLIQQEANDQQ